MKYYSSITIYDSGFTLGKDNNNFINNPISSFKRNGFTVTETRGDYRAVPIYKFNDKELFDTLCDVADEDEETIKEKAESPMIGICFGASATMALVNNRQLDLSDLTSKEGILDYYHLPKPKKDDRFSDVLKYYHLQQWLSSIDENTEFAIGKKGEKKFKHPEKAKALPVVLKDLVDATREAASRGEAIVLGFDGYYSEEAQTDANYFGHEVIVTGLRELPEGYNLKVYDLNNNTRFTSMIVSADYQTFKLTTDNHVMDESNIRSLDFKEASIFFDLSGKPFNHLSNRNDTSSVTVGTNNDSDVLVDGNLLYTKKTQRTPVVPIKTMTPILNGNNSSETKFTVDDYNRCSVENSTGELSVRVNNSKGYMSLQGNNIESANIEPGNTMVIEGDNYNFKFTATTNHNVADGSKGMVSVSGTAEDDVEVTVEGDEIRFESNGDISDVITTKYVGAETERNSVPGDLRELAVDDAFDWAQPTYEWKSDFSSVKATRVSLDDPNRIETETVKTSKSAEDTADKNIVEITYTATFANPAFGVQSQVMDTAKLKQPMKAGVLQAFTELITARCWGHLWYLYLLIGLYVLLPFYRKLTEHCTDQELLYLCGAYLLFVSIIPMIEGFGIHVGFYISESIIYPLYLFMGYMIFSGRLRISGRAGLLLLIGATLCILILDYMKYGLSIGVPGELFGYASPVVIAQTMGVFTVLSKDWSCPDACSRFLETVDGCSFGIYLIHMVFIRLLFRYMQIDPYQGIAVINLVLIVLGILVVSFVITWVLKRIPGVRWVL